MRILAFCALGTVSLLRSAEPATSTPLELKGTISLKNAPTLRWRALSQNTGTSAETVSSATDVVVESDGFTGSVHLQLEGARNRGSWEIPALSLSLESWLPPLAEKLGWSESLGDLASTGELRMSGKGTLRPDAISGEATTRIENASLSSFSRGLEVRGITLQADLLSLSPLRSPKHQGLTFQDLKVGTVHATDGEFRFEILDGQQTRIDQATVNIFGGRIALSPLVLNWAVLREGEVEGTLLISDLSLSEVALLLPSVIAEARGKLSGRIGVRWSAKNGFLLGTGSLQLDRVEAVEIRLKPQPGFLTQHTPERIPFPAWLGPLARLAPKNPAFETVRQIEMGLMSLQVETLEARVTPDGDAAGRSANVKLVAKPSQASAVERVEFQVNVSGPLDEVVKLSLGNSVSVKMGP